MLLLDSIVHDIWIDMKQKTTNGAQFAICIDNSEYPASLELHKLYRVLQDDDAMQDGNLRVIDESGEDYLFPAEYFILLRFPSKTERAVNRSFLRRHHLKRANRSWKHILRRPRVKAATAKSV